MRTGLRRNLHSLISLHPLLRGFCGRGGISRNRYLPLLPDRLEPATVDNDDGIFHSRTAGAVDQRAALHRQNLACHFPSDYPHACTRR